MKKVLLAFSGGLDTTYCALYLAREKHMQVHTALANTGGFTPDALRKMAQQARQLGVASHQTLDVVDDYYQRVIRYLIFGHVLKHRTYPLSVSAERTVQAMALARYAKEIGAQAIAHGSTGAGNDQIRFDLTFQVLAPDLEIITPIRDQQLSREQEIAYLQQQGVAGEWKQKPYSINQGLWGTSVGGAETLQSRQPLPDEAFPRPLEKSGSEALQLQFTRGELTGVNNQVFVNPAKAIQALDALLAPWAIGRDTHVGDTILGTKGRVGFEAGAALLIIEAHALLEKHVLSKWQLQWKEQLGNWYGMLLHEAQYLDPAMRDIEAFLQNSQQTVIGRVFVRLYPYRFQLEGIASDYDLMDTGFSEYGEMNKAWSAEDVKGFTRIYSNHLKLQQRIATKQRDTHDNY